MTEAYDLDQITDAYERVEKGQVRFSGGDHVLSLVPMRLRLIIGRETPVIVGMRGKGGNPDCTGLNFGHGIRVRNLFNGTIVRAPDKFMVP